MAPFSVFSAEILAMVNFLFFLSLHPPTFEQEILELFKERGDVNPNDAMTGAGTIERRWRSRELTPCELGRKAIEEEGEESEHRHAEMVEEAIAARLLRKLRKWKRMSHAMANLYGMED